MHWMILPYRRYFEFTGRSRRKEYWFFALFTTLVIVILAGLLVGLVAANLPGLVQGSLPPLETFGAAALGGMALIAVFVLVSLIPGLSVQVRRLHDLGVSGWWYLAFVVSGGVLDQIPNVGPGLNSLVTLGWIVWMFLPGTKGANKYGEDPKDPVNAAIFA